MEKEFTLYKVRPVHKWDRNFMSIRFRPILRLLIGRSGKKTSMRYDRECPYNDNYTASLYYNSQHSNPL